MAQTNTYKRLAATRPAGVAEVSLYNPGANTEAIGILHICNQTGSAVSISVALTDADAAAGSEDWLLSGVSLGAYEFIQLSGITLDGDVPNTLRVVTGTADAVSFVFMGLEKVLT